MLTLNLFVINRSHREWHRSLIAGVAIAATIVCATTANAADVTVRIMTQNVYQGTNFDEVAAATSLAPDGQGLAGASR